MRRRPRSCRMPRLPEMSRLSRSSSAVSRVTQRRCARTKIGPSLAGVFGRKSASEPTYNYSPALKSAGITWDEQELDKFLTNPASDVPGTKMVVSVPNAEDRQNVIAYLKTLK